MQEQHRVSLLARKFGIKVKKSTSNYRGVHRLYLKNGKQYCLKRVPYPLHRLRWIDKTLQRIRKDGFPFLAWRDPRTPEGKKLYVSLKQKLGAYTLMPWIEGRWPKPTSKQDMLLCGSTLARFHQTGTKAQRGKTPEKVNKLGTWPVELRQKGRRFNKNIDRVIENSPNKQLQELLLASKAELSGYCKQALELLKSDTYVQECRKQNIPICHGDGGPTNFMITGKQAYLLDFETLRKDLRAYDLYRIIYNSCKDYNWDFSIAEAILDGYQSVTKLRSEDLYLTKVWLRFPRTMELLAKDYLRAPQKNGNSTAQFTEALMTERNMNHFLKQLDHYATTKLEK